jgi:hypothetical protein
MKFVGFLLLLLPYFLTAQVIDDFSDGDFTENPVWQGNAEHFVVNDDLMLQLNSEGENTSVLTTAFDAAAPMEWRFRIKLSFSPSTNNYARFYLSSDVVDPALAQQAWFVQFGESGSTDAIELFRQDGASVTSICRGTEGLIANSFDLWMRVRVDEAGNWSIERADSPQSLWLPEAQGIAAFPQGSHSLGVLCKYTASNSKRFYFDDVYAGLIDVDVQPPKVVQVLVIGSNTLDILFDEAIDEADAETLANYNVLPQIGYPLTAERDNTSPALVHLTFDRDFPNATQFTISIQNIADLVGNVMEPAMLTFSHFTPATHDVVINEIMADPSPPVGLPDWEYLELFNTTDFDINLTGWKLLIGSTEKLIADANIAARGFLILGHKDAAPEFGFGGPFYGFSSFALTNAGQQLVLMNPQGAVISAITYSDTWYNDPLKKDGGWSLEQIDPMNACGDKANWNASVSHLGGTPGVANSVDAFNPDVTRPFAKRVEITDTATLILHFSEPMDSLLMASTNLYEVEPGALRPVAVQPVFPDNQKVILQFATAFSATTIYTLSLTGNISDCAGNLVDQSRTVQFGLPAEVAPLDVVINEVLFNPKDDFVTGVDFVEIYNRSDKIIDLSKMMLATEDKATGSISTPKNISTTSFLFFPQQYLVLTTKPEVVAQQYFTSVSENFLQLASLPSYSNDAGVVVLTTLYFETIDRFAYREKMQYPLLTTYDGVSLERINYDRPASDSTNWHSAAEDVGFATPGLQNSQFSPLLVADDPITVAPEIFSPDNDGSEDVLNIHYNYQEPGRNASITIYDARGRKVRQLIDHELLGTSGQFSWDGLDDQRQKAAIGIYIIYVEVFDLNGNVDHYKKTAVLATRL